MCLSRRHVAFPSMISFYSLYRPACRVYICLWGHSAQFQASHREVELGVKVSWPFPHVRACYCPLLVIVSPSSPLSHQANRFEGDSTGRLQHSAAFVCPLHADPPAVVQTTTFQPVLVLHSLSTVWYVYSTLWPLHLCWLVYCPLHCVCTNISRVCTLLSTVYSPLHIVLSPNS